TEQVKLDLQEATNIEAFREGVGSDQGKSQKFWLTTTLLSLAGLAVLSATGVALYRAFAYIHVDSAAIARSFEEIISTHRGQLTNLYVKEGMTIEAGQPLFRVYDEQMAQFVAEDEARNIQQRIRDHQDDLERLQRELKLTQAEQEQAQAQLQIARSRQQEEINQLGVSKQVTEKQLAQAQARLESLETQYETAQKRLEREKFLLQEGAIAEERVDRARDHLADVEGELKTARKDVEIKKYILATINQGSFYNGERFNGNLPELKAKVAEAQETIAQTSREIAIYQQDIQEKQQKVAQLEQQYRNQDFQLPIPKLSDPEAENIFSQVYESPMDATVVQIREAAGESIQIGETLLVLQPNSERPLVDAFFTQDQAARLSIGQEAKVTSTHFPRSYEAKVVNIDRSGGLRDEIRGRYQFEGSTTRPAYVQLEILNTTPKNQNFLTPGTPLEVTIRKENFIL
ncbi:MAG: HlyD family efflux transporter periplasmic adaptor subunit, partial [Halothece sp. Uz-M2-17]|nr:HlyD family efflux transporter periplasmic adaptor subunit [Halothece sp. Uz-M2-17]